MSLTESGDATKLHPSEWTSVVGTEMGYKRELCTPLAGHVPGPSVFISDDSTPIPSQAHTRLLGFPVSIITSKINLYWLISHSLVCSVTAGKTDRDSM